MPPTKRRGPALKSPEPRNDQLPSRIEIHTKNDARKAQAAIVDWNDIIASVFDGRRCLGHLLRTCQGFKAIDADEREIGEYESASVPRDAIWQAGRSA